MALAGSVCLMYEEHDTSTLADTQVLLVSPLLGVAAAPLPLLTSLYSLLPLLRDSHMPSLSPPLVHHVPLLSTSYFSIA